MNTIQINRILKQELGDTFLGVFSRNTIPESLPTGKPIAMVVNTHPSHKPGEHWVAFYINGKEGEYFDSYGLPPPLDFELLLDRYCISYKYNAFQLQDYLSFVCGQYCLYYLYHRHLGESMTSIIKRLREAGDANDAIVADFVAQNWDVDDGLDGQRCGCLRDYCYN